MSRLLALADIWTDMGFRHYRPGDFLPEDHPDSDGWIRSGAAKVVPECWTPPTYVKAAAVSCAGLPGIVPGGEDVFIGRLPKRRGRRPECGG